MKILVPVLDRATIPERKTLWTLIPQGLPKISWTQNLINQELILETGVVILKLQGQISPFHTDQTGPGVSLCDKGFILYLSH